MESLLRTIVSINQLIALTLASLLIIYLIIKFQNLLTLKKTIAFHSITSSYVPRIGGLCIFFCLIAANIVEYFHGNWLNLFLISIIILPTFISGVLEDLLQNISPKVRLFFSFLTAILFLLFFDPISNYDVPFLKIIENYWVSSFITIIAIMSLTNASNLIDGLNGLCIFNFLAVISSLILISYFDSLFFYNYYIYLLIILGILFPLNFPFAKIFLGDSGAYILGSLSAILIINFFNSYTLYSPWNAILILIYPIVETLYTFTRRIFEKKDVMSPDNFHLHNLFFNKINKYSINFSNPTSTVAMLPFIFFGPLMAVFFRHNIYVIVISISVFIAVYLITIFKFTKHAKIT